MTRKEKIAFWILEVLIVLFSVISTLFLNEFIPIIILYGIIIGTVFGTVLLLCIMWTYYAIKRKKVAFTIAGIITVPLALFMLLSMITVFTILWVNTVVIILTIIDFLYFIIAMSIQHFKK